MDNPTLGLNTNLEGGLYRYQGEAGNVNNFVCFGTTSKEECLSDTDKYMYRVMGINENNQVKLIKKEALNTAYQWHSDATIDITDAKIETCLLAGEGTTFIRPNLEVNNNVCLEASGELTIQGNLVLNGGRKPISGNVFQYMMNANEAKKYFGGVDYIVWENVPTISITGTLTLKADTAVTFWNDDETGGYYIPSSGEALFICGKLENQASLNKLKPYAVKMEITDYEEYEGEIYPIGDYTQIKFLSDYEFEACTGEGGLTYIYLVSGSSTAPSGSGSAGGSAPAPAPGLNVSSGQTVEISQKPDSFVNMWLIATGWGIC